MKENMGRCWGSVSCFYSGDSFKNRVAGCELKMEIIQIIPRNPEHVTPPNSIL